MIKEEKSDKRGYEKEREKHIAMLKKILSHGHDHPRAVGAIGGRFPQHVRKGLRMAGRMGGVRTVINLEVIGIDPKKNLIAVKGAVPGARGNMVLIQA